MAIGIDLSVMTLVGASLEEFQFGIMEYLVVGEMIIEIICGEVIHGTTVLYITVIFKETGEPGITPIIGINQKIVSLHIAMMEDCMKVDKESLAQALKERLEQVNKGVLTKVLQLKKALFTKVPQLGKERLEQVGMVLQVLKSMAQVKPPKVSILQQQKGKRNEVYVEEQEVNCPTNGHSERLTASVALRRYASFESEILNCLINPDVMTCRRTRQDPKCRNCQICLKCTAGL